MTTIVAATEARDERAPLAPKLLTKDEMDAVTGGRRPPDYIIPRVPPAVMLDPVEAAS